MAHFAEIDENNIVKRVIVAEQDFIDSGAVGDSSNWIQTSYNTMGGVHYTPNSNHLEPDGGVALRKNFAGIGYIYDSDKDAFYQPQPYPSWLLNEDTCRWESPIPHPDDDKRYKWNEENQSWDRELWDLEDEV